MAQQEEKPATIPVSVHGDRVHIKDAEMEVGKDYIVKYKSLTLAFRKLPNGRIDVFKLSK